MLTQKISVGAWGTAGWHFGDLSESILTSCLEPEVQAWGQERSEPWWHLVTSSLHFLQTKNNSAPIPNTFGWFWEPHGTKSTAVKVTLNTVGLKPVISVWVTLIEKALKLGYRIAKLGCWTYQTLKLYDVVSSVGKTGFIPWHYSGWLAMGAWCWPRCLGWVWAHSS